MSFNASNWYATNNHKSSKESTKIFLMHKWRQPYLKTVIKQLLLHNNPENVVLFTDNKEKTKKFLWYEIVCENITDYFSYASKFENIYKHLSYNGMEFELLCLQRWVVMLEYMEKYNINSCWHVDSDVLVYCDLLDYSSKYLSDYDFCPVAISWGTFYWTRNGLHEFKKFLFETYSSKLDKLESYHKKEWACVYTRNDSFMEYEQTWCVSDMTLFYLFIKESLKWVKYKDIGMINYNEYSVFDDNINRWVWFIFFKFIKPFIKKIYYDKTKKKFYSYLKSNLEDKIYFNCLHFQWYVKCIIDDFYEGNKYLFIKPYFKLICASLKINIKKVFKVIKKIIWID